MRDGEWRLVYPGTDLTFGTIATPVWNMTTPEVGDASIRTDDSDRPRSDGIAMGVDFKGGQTISFDLGVRADTEAEVRARAAGLKKAWDAFPVRSVGGAVAELRSQYAGRERVVYGRPRRFTPNYSDASTNHIVTAVADFGCVDDRFYGLSEDSVDIQLVPSPSGGLIAPLSAPLGTTSTSDRSKVIDVNTELPAWPVVELHGPITNPVVDIVGLFRFELAATLAYDDVVVLDTRPWVRTVLRNGSISLAGKLTRASARLADASIPAGRYEVSLRGSDATGTAMARVRWRCTYSTF